MEERLERFTSLLTAISRSIHKIKTEEMKEFDLKSSHLSCIYYLYKKDSLTAKELCEYCEEDKANISRSIKYLEENGYLSCNSQTTKRYQCPFRLTERGREVGKRISEKLSHIMEMAGLDIHEDERLAMYHSLSLICDNLQTICDRYDKKKTPFSLKATFERLKRVSKSD